MERRSSGAVFNDSILPDGDRRWGSFGIGFVLECVAVTIVVVLPMLMPQKFEAVRNYWVTRCSAYRGLKPLAAPKPVDCGRKRIVVAKEISAGSDRSSAENLHSCNYESDCEAGNRVLLPSPIRREVGERFPIPILQFPRQFRDSDVEETARRSANRRLRRSRRREGQRQDQYESKHRNRGGRLRHAGGSGSG